MRTIITNIVTRQSDDHKPIIPLPDFIKGFEVIKRKRRPKKKLENYVVMPAEEKEKPIPMPRSIPDTNPTAVDNLNPTLKSKKLGKKTLQTISNTSQTMSVPIEVVNLAEIATNPDSNVQITEDEEVIELPLPSIDIPPPQPGSLEEVVVPVESLKSSVKSTKRKKKPPLTGSLLIKEEIMQTDPSSKPKSSRRKKRTLIENPAVIEEQIIMEKPISMQPPSFTPPPLPSDAISDPVKEIVATSLSKIPTEQSKKTGSSSTKRKKPKLIGPLKVVSE